MYTHIYYTSTSPSPVIICIYYVLYTHEDQVRLGCTGGKAIEIARQTFRSRMYKTIIIIIIHNSSFCRNRKTIYNRPVWKCIKVRTHEYLCPIYNIQ